MIKPHDSLATFYWYKEVITDPYQVIAAFFDHGDIAHYRKLVKGMLLHVCSNKIFYKNAPGNLLFEYKMLESLIRAADVIRKGKTKKHYAIPKEDLFNKKWYCSRHDTCG
ncbi:MAG: hypothetical protein IPJ81_09570 [Chitinophagaceae bacterium]|nr:hypothetical protein [Chitinophagaceae bacterium]